MYTHSLILLRFLNLMVLGLQHTIQANFLTVPHLLEVPEKRLIALLAGITVQPFRGLAKQSTQQVTVRSSEDRGSRDTAETYAVRMCL